MGLRKWFCQHSNPEPLSIVPASGYRISNYGMSLYCHECKSTLVRYNGWMSVDFATMEFGVLVRSWKPHQKKK